MSLFLVVARYTATCSPFFVYPITVWLDKFNPLKFRNAPFIPIGVTVEHGTAQVHYYWQITDGRRDRTSRLQLLDVTTSTRDHARRQEQ